MSEWQEDNFLERLTHDSREHAGPVLCPEAEALYAGTDSEGVGPISAQLEQHIQHCPLCSDVQNRLDLFNQDESLVSDAEAIEAEKHLDSWLKGFLASESLNLRAPTVIATPSETVSPAPVKARIFWMVNWALSAAAMILVVAGVVYFRRPSNMQTPPPVVVRAIPDQPPTPLDLQASPHPIPADQSGPQAVAPKNSPLPKPPKLVSPPRKTDAPAPRQGIAAAPKQENQSGSLAAEAIPPGATEMPAVAENHPPPRYGTPVHPILPPAPTSLSHGSTSGTALGRKPIDCITCTPAHGQVTRTASPPFVLIPAGTRIWISLNSTNPQNDGSSHFQGALLLPVSASNSLLLEKGTLVAGVGLIAEGQTSLQILELVLDNRHYKLRTDSSVRAQQAIPPSKAVEFESGKVIELWLDSAAVFELVEAHSAAPQN